MSQGVGYTLQLLLHITHCVSLQSGDGGESETPALARIIALSVSVDPRAEEDLQTFISRYYVYVHMYIHFVT